MQNNPCSPSQIRALTFNKLTLAMDCIGSDATATFCLSSLSTTEPSTYTSLLHIQTLPATDNRNPNISNNFTLAFTAFNRELRLKPGTKSPPTTFPASPTDRSFMEDFNKNVLQRLVDENKIKFMPISKGEGNGSDVWENVLAGIDDVRTGRRGKGEKVVVEVGNEKWLGWSMC